MTALLADDFDVVGVATGGDQAIDAARQLNPEVIVLDVNMPGLDGFQTIRALGGPAAPPVVFLSLHDTDDIVGQAFRCGGRGYVLKSRMGRDLAAALEQVLHGRLYVPSLPALLKLPDGGRHAMHLHDGAEPCLDDLAALFVHALRRGDATCIVGTESVREGLRDRLRARGWNVGGPSGHERYLAIDRNDALNRFMRNGLPDADRVADIVAELNQQRLAVAEGATPRLVVCGNLSASLAADGNVEAAIALESLWDGLTRGLPFVTVCGYSTSCFHDGIPDFWSGACSAHGALNDASDL
jgi:CheY-like chemotaxis protein